MIISQMECQLGNNLFQYMAARFTADRLGVKLAVRMNTGRKSAIRQSFLGGSLSAPVLQGIQGLEHSRFGGLINTFDSLGLHSVADGVTNFVTDAVFRPRYVDTVNGWKFEEYDEEFHHINDRTLLTGFYQSQRYFGCSILYAKHAINIDKKTIRRAAHFLLDRRLDPNTTIAVHIRRGDYARMREPFSTSEDGWCMPLSWYLNQVNLLPHKLDIVVLSDDIEWVKKNFVIDRRVVYSNNGPLVDLCLISICKYCVISNSTFSWWGAYLGGSERRKVIAPKYWMGFRAGKTMPSGIEVDWWEYAPVINSN